LDFIAERRGETFTWHDIPSEDAATYEMISHADTVGVFQIESRAQMSMLARLQPRCFYDLVIQVAIVRPGPIQGGMVHPYLRRRMGEEPVEYESEEIRSVLERTLGVPIFQEQVIAIAMVAAGFTAGEADQLRRAMAAWKKKGGLDKFYDRLVNGMTERSYTKEFAERIYAQIHGFSEYGFPESHSASFALLVYVSAWIKCHEPAVFLAALLNSQPMGFYTPSQLIQDAKRHGVEVRPADVMVSEWDCTLEENPTAQYGVGPQPAVRLGLRLIKGMSAEGAESLVFTRAVRPFASVDDLARRAQLSTHDLQALARANALLTLSGHRRQAAWQVSGMKTMPRLLKNAPIAEESLSIAKASEGQEVVADYASMGLTLNKHPLAILRQKLTAMNLSTAEELKRFPDRKLARTTGIVTVRQRPGTANGVLFMTLEDETGNTNVIVWPDLLEKFRREALNAKLLTVYGVMQTDGRVVHLLAKRLVDHSELLGDLHIRSYDFH
jgi:error-prone DNA polymerase